MVRLLAIALFAIFAMSATARILAGGSEIARKDAQAQAPAKPERQNASRDEYANAGQIVIRRDASGRFYLDADVNGQPVRFLIDTGADAVALTMDDAAQLGIDVDPATLRPVARTASGIGYGAPVTLDRLDIAGQELRNVRAVVVDGLGMNLLGQSILRQLGRIELHGNELTIG